MSAPAVAEVFSHYVLFPVGIQDGEGNGMAHAEADGIGYLYLA